jgi:hypothetical protein
MKPIRQSLATLAAALCIAAFSESAGAAFAGSADAPAVSSTDAAVLYAPLPAHASLYSFSDVFRLTAGSMPLAESPLAPAQGTPVALPVSAAPAPSHPAPAAQAAQAEAEYRFSIGSVPEPRRWLLILSGLALAGWVARRRLGHSF